MKRPTPAWLNDAIFYEIYPQNELRSVYGDKVPHRLAAGRCRVDMAPVSFGIFEAV